MYPFKILETLFPQYIPTPNDAIGATDAGNSFKTELNTFDDFPFYLICGTMLKIFDLFLSYNFETAPTHAIGTKIFPRN